MQPETSMDTETMRQALADAVAADGRTLQAIAAAAGLDRHRLRHIIERGDHLQGTADVLRLAEVIGATLAHEGATMARGPVENAGMKFAE